MHDAGVGGSVGALVFLLAGATGEDRADGLLPLTSCTVWPVRGVAPLGSHEVWSSRGRHQGLGAFPQRQGGEGHRLLDGQRSHWQRRSEADAARVTRLKSRANVSYRWKKASGSDNADGPGVGGGSVCRLVSTGLRELLGQ